MSDGIKTHLFVIAPNNSGSTMLRNAIVRSSGCWRLPREGQHVAGFAGPSTRGTELRLIWASSPHRLAHFTRPGAYDWARIAAAWQRCARADDPVASVLAVSSPPFLFCIGELLEAFRDTRFIFLVRNPYAVAEAICRRAAAQPLLTGENISAVAAAHVVTCLEQQRRNIETLGKGHVVLAYEDLCADPAGAREMLLDRVPELGRVDLRFPGSVKMMYDEPLRDMNAQQIARLSGEDLSVLNGVFDGAEGVIEYFGYQRLS